MSSRRARFDAHGTNRHLALQLLHADLQQPPRLVRREDVTFAAAAAPQVDADTGSGHAPEVPPQGDLVHGTVFGERGDADDKSAGSGPVDRSMLPAVKGQALPTWSNLKSLRELPHKMACFSSGGTSANVALMVFHDSGQSVVMWG